MKKNLTTILLCLFSYWGICQPTMSNKEAFYSVMKVNDFKANTTALRGMNFNWSWFDLYINTFEKGKFEKIRNDEFKWPVYAKNIVNEIQNGVSYIDFDKTYSFSCNARLGKYNMDLGYFPIESLNTDQVVFEHPTTMNSYKIQLKSLNDSVFDKRLFMRTANAERFIDSRKDANGNINRVVKAYVKYKISPRNMLRYCTDNKVIIGIDLHEISLVDNNMILTTLQNKSSQNILELKKEIIGNIESAKKCISNITPGTVNNDVLKSVTADIDRIEISLLSIDESIAKNQLAHASNLAQSFKDQIVAIKKEVCEIGNNSNNNSQNINKDGNLKLTFLRYEEGDNIYLVFKDIASNNEIIFDGYDESKLNGIRLLVYDPDATFELKANPIYINKNFIVKALKKKMLANGPGDETYMKDALVIDDLKEDPVNGVPKQVINVPKDAFVGVYHGHETHVEISLVAQGKYKIEFEAEGNLEVIYGTLVNGSIKFIQKDYQGKDTVHFFILQGTDCIKDGYYEYCKE